MKSKAQIKEQRRIIRELLERIIDGSSEIDRVLGDEKHPRGIVYRSLKPCKEEYITHLDKGFVAGYRAEDGQLYEISIHKMEVPKK